MAVVKAVVVQRALKAHASLERAKTNAWFFKTGPGEYGEGDRFVGVRMPDLRKVAKEHQTLVGLGEVQKLLAHPVHEYRLCALVILVHQFERAQKAGDRAGQKKIVQFYLDHIDTVNNWDLVDVSVHKILGAYYRDYGGEKRLYTLAKSKSLWRRRIAIIATAAFIAHDRFEHTLAIAELLIDDKEDLIHKATGWMLREVGKRDKKVLEKFLRIHVHDMPRTMLRYAIERFPKSEYNMWINKRRSP